MQTPHDNLSAWLEERAAARQTRYQQRKRRVLTASHSTRVSTQGRALVNFSSNDYLGLAAHPEVIAALKDTADSCGVGSGASALVTGYRKEHQILEQELAEFLQREKVLLCSSGYLANLAVATSLTRKGDAIIQDKFCHASLIDAARMSDARLLRYAHADTKALRRRLTAAAGDHRLVVTDGVFSMDGDTAPLREIASLCAESQSWLAVDDAHGVGVCGPGGRGSVAAAGLDGQQVPILTGTLGKAFGCFGAFVAGSEALVGHLVNEARSYIYTTAMPPALAAASRVALKKIIDEDWRRERLNALIEQFRHGASRRGLELLPSDTPIQPLLVGDSQKALKMAENLCKSGFLVVAIRPPTVPRGTARLRITLSAAHDSEQLDALLEAIESCQAT